MRQSKTLPLAARDTVLAMRVHQWLKNLLIFVPAATGHRILMPDVFSRISLAFLSFSLCASAGYVVNDLIDRKADGRHPSKRHRPFASGALPRWYGVLLAAILFAAAVGLGSLISGRFLLFLCGYLVLALAYSAALKTVLLVDIFLLAFFYTFRVLLGGEAGGIRVSFWLAAFSTFFFFSLAVMKRFIELRLVEADKAGAARRDYRLEDLTMLGMWGAATGCASVVVLALYINSADVTALYRHPVLLWPVCLAFLYWLSRAWMLANRDQLPFDPIEFALKDPPSYIVALFILVSILTAL
jgi:4-hydroxybenzoate polyprenyltransferase